MIQKLFTWIIIFSCSAISSFGMELNTPIELQENTPLNRHTIVTFCPIESLPEDPFWKIIFDNGDPLTQTEIYNLSCTSKMLQGRFGMLIPKTILSRFPTVFQYLNALSAIEWAENKYQDLFQRYPSQMFYLKDYPHEIERLLKAEPYVRLSPWFRLKLGSQRINILTKLHNIDPPEDDRECTEKIRCWLSAITRDPLVVTGLALTTVGVMALLGWEIKKTEFTYNQAYLKNLNYTSTQKFVGNQMQPACPGCENFYSPTYPSCFQDSSFGDPSLTCWNQTTICAGGRVNNPQLNDALFTTIQSLLTTIGKLNEAWDYILPSFSYQDINNSISPNFIPYCTEDYAHDSFLGRLKNSSLLIESYIQAYGGKNSPNCVWDDNWPFHQSFGIWMINLHNYDPHCIARAMTPKTALASLITTVSFIQFSLIAIFIIGWSITF